MGELSKIEWCDHTFNPWEGCTKVSPGCAHCYAETRNARFGGGTAPNWGKGAPRRRTSAANWKEPLRWNRESAERADEAKRNGGFYHVMERGLLPYHRPRVFCASLADWLDDEVPVEWLADLLDLIRLTPHLDWLLLTKRPGNFEKRIKAVLNLIPRPIDATLGQSASLGMILLAWLSGGKHIKPDAPANVWIGTTVEDQARAVDRIPLLLSIPARVRFLSCEPLLGPIDFYEVPGDNEEYRLDWVICGGESGSGARPMNLAWAESLRGQCQSARVPFFMKQLGACPGREDGRPWPITDKKGNLMAEWPTALRVREFPEVADV